MRFPIILLFACLCFGSSAQSFDHLWSFSLGDGEGELDEVTALKVLADGDIITGGNFRGYHDFDPDSAGRALGKSVVSGGELYLARYSPAGDLRWLRFIRGGRSMSLNRLTISQGSVYLAGGFIDRIDFTPEQPGGSLDGVSPNDNDGFLAKFSLQGDFQWASRAAGTGIDGFVDSEINSQGELITFGFFGDSLLFDPNNPLSLRISAGAGDCFIASYDTSSGGLNWVESISGLGFDNPRGLELDAQDNIYVSGDFTATLTFSLNPLVSLVRVGGNDLFLAKYGPRGQFRWAKRLGGTSTDLGADLLLAGDTTLVVCGTFRFNFTPDPGASPFTSQGGEDVFLAAYDTSGNYRWAHGFGGTSTDRSYRLAADDSGRVWTVGYFVNTVDFDPDPNTTVSFNGPGGDPFAVAYRLDNGAFARLERATGSGFAAHQAIDYRAPHGLFVGGVFYNDLDSDPQGPGGLVNSSSGSSHWIRYRNGAYDTTWIVSDRKGGNDEVRDLLNDAQGNLYVAGYFEGEVDFDPDTSEAILVSQGGEDGFVVSYDPQGRLRWIEQFGGPGGQEVNALALHPSGILYLGGDFENQIIRGSDTLQSVANRSLFFARLNTQGQVQWIAETGGLSNNFLEGVAAGPDGSLVIGGSGRGSLNLNPALSGAYPFNPRNWYGYVAKYDSSGSYQWGFVLDSTSNDYVYDVAVDDSANVLVAGSYRLTVDFSRGLGTGLLSSQFNGNDAFVAKYDANGQFRWVRAYGQNGFEGAQAVATDPRGNVYLSGQFSSTQDFDPNASAGSTQTASGGEDVFQLCLSPGGAYRWVATLGGSSSDFPTDLKVVDGLVFATGAFRNSIDLDPGPDSLLATAVSAEDAYLQVLDTAGQFVAGLTLGGNIDDWGQAISHHQGNTYLGGYLELGFDADPGNQEAQLISAGDRDGFLIKFGQAGPCPPVFDTIADTACGTYAWYGQNLTQSGFFTQTLVNTQGCDSLLTLQLTLYPSFDSLLTASACDSFAWRGQFYTQSGSYTDSLTTIQGCDSVYQLNLTINNSVFASQSITACDSFAWRGRMLSQSGTYFDTATTPQGCDSVYQLNLTINNSVFASQSITACDSFAWRGRMLSRSGTYFDTASTPQGCDSVYQLNLTINNSVFASQSITACDSFAWRGRMLSQSGTYFDTATTPQGCDSVYQLNLTINNSVFASQSITACDSFAWRGRMLSRSGTYFDTASTPQGCDSVYQLNLTINNSVFASQSITACDSFAWRGRMLSQSGTYFDTATTPQGCDSVYQLNLTINNSVFASQSITACDSFAWRGRMLSRSGTYFDTATTPQGCDSVYQLNLQIDTLSLMIATNGFNATALQTNASYQWLLCDSNFLPLPGATAASFNPTSSGNYAVRISRGTCIDTSDCLFLQGIGLPEAGSQLLAVFPNPSAGIFRVRWPGAGTYRWTVYDASGREIEAGEGVGDQDLPLGEKWPPGHYQLQVQNQYEQAHRALIKK